MATTKVVTADELAQFPADERYELIRGVLREISPTNGRHARLMGNVSGPLWLHNAQYDLGVVYIGDAGVIIEREPDTVLAPDIAFIQSSRLPSGSVEEGFLSVVPDLVIEIVSPSDRMLDVRGKVARYLAAGVRQVWVVEPRRRMVIVFDADGTERTLGEGDVLDGGDVVPGFRLAVADIFRQPRDQGRED